MASNRRDPGVSMPGIPADEQELADHRQTFEGFLHMVTFAASHVALTLGCLALAFIGHTVSIALLIWVAGSILLGVVLVAHGASRMKDIAARFSIASPDDKASGGAGASRQISERARRGEPKLRPTG